MPRTTTVSYSAPVLDEKTLRPTGARHTGRLFLAKERGRWRIDLAQN